MRTILELQSGDEIQAYMVISRSLEVGRRVDGSLYRFVPERPQKASPTALSRFQGQVITNDTTEQVLTVRTMKLNSQKIPVSNDIPLVAHIHYSCLGRVLLLSPVHFEPREEVRRGGTYFRPTTKALGTNFKAYRTLTKLRIPR